MIELSQLTKSLFVDEEYADEDFAVLLLKKDNNRNLVTWFFERGHITQIELERLHQMIDSDDLENYTVALEILKQKAKDVSNIQSRKP